MTDAGTAREAELRALLHLPTETGDQIGDICQGISRSVGWQFIRPEVIELLNLVVCRENLDRFRAGGAPHTHTSPRE